MELSKGKLKDIFSYIKWYDWCIIAVVYAVLAVIVLHGDMIHTAKSSFAILEGHLADFYSYNKPIVGGNDYDILIYLFFAAWNLPLLLMGKSISYPSLDAFSSIYEKLMLIVFIFLSAWIIYKICTRLGANKRKAFYAAFLLFTAPSMLIMGVGFGMYDILYGFLALCGFYMFIREKTKYDEIIGVLLFGLSFAVKPFAAFLFIPLVAYRHKKIWKCLLLYLISILPLIAFKIPYLSFDVVSTSGRFMDYLFGTSYNNGMWNIPVFFLAYILVCLWSYHVKYDKDQPIKAVYVALIGMLPLYVFMIWHPQWSMLYVILFSILAAMNQNKKKMLLFDCIFSIAFIGYIWSAFGNGFAEMGVINGATSVGVSYDLSVPFWGLPNGHIRPLGVYLATMIAVIISAAYCFNPWKFKQDYCLDAEITKKDYFYARLRFLIPILVFLVPILLWRVQAAV